VRSIKFKSFFKFIIFINFLFIYSCGGVKDKIGLIKKSPDEFQVYENKPLSVPPNFDLRAPVDSDLVTNNSEEDNIIFSEEKSMDEALTIGDEVLLITLGDKDTDKDIRKIINKENSISEIEKPLLDKILDFEPILTVQSETDNELDPEAEKERIDKLKEEDKKIDAIISEKEGSID
jgi:hypothetical protein